MPWNGEKYFNHLDLLQDELMLSSLVHNSSK